MSFSRKLKMAQASANNQSTNYAKYRPLNTMMSSYNAYYETINVSMNKNTLNEVYFRGQTSNND